MWFKSRTPKTANKAPAQTSIYPWSWAVLIAGLVLFLSTIFVSRWTSNGPTFFSADDLSAPADYSLSLTQGSDSSPSQPLLSPPQSDLSKNPSLGSPTQSESSE